MQIKELMTSGYANNLGALEEMYVKFQEDPTSVDSSWRHLFGDEEKVSVDQERAVLRIYHLIEAYRTYGHLAAKINPIASEDREFPQELTLESLGFESQELEALFPTCGILEQPVAPLKKIVAALTTIYCGTVGIEYMGLQRPELERMLQEEIEPNRFSVDLSIQQKKMILQHLNKSELFEVFLNTKYVGQKRFSLEGGETLIPMLAAVVETGTDLGLQELVLGMAHRGRLNVLSNILEKSYAEIFSEFEGSYIPLSFEGSGDVKYHKGFAATIETEKGKTVDIFLTPNASHLESVDPVVEGEVYAKQLQRGDTEKNQIIPVLIHGDAAISGQGVVYETLQMCDLQGYGTGGTLHIVVNNQIGFTTLPEEGRSTRYCTDIARAFSAPVFHVNAEDPEGCVYAVNLALEIRHRFHCDVFIDLNCFRKYGHNEADEPAFTQPLEYQRIRKKTSIRELYRDDLIQQGVLERQMAEALEEEFRQSMQKELSAIQEEKRPSPKKRPKKGVKEDVFAPVKTAVSKKVLQEVAEKMNTPPAAFTIHKKLEGLLEERKNLTGPINWGMGELLAYGTLLWEGTPIRLAGQDSCRGTFSHRHAMLVDQKRGETYIPLQHLKEGQGHFEVINSHLSEYGCLGFEYGVSLAWPEALVIWEAQFGDFCNGAQVVIDQYLSTAEQKWGQRVGLVLLLPHGYEGQGPEHSSGRIERFLTLCGDQNMSITEPSTPAQLFHLLRRHIVGKKEKPLIIFTPKALLRHPECVNQAADFTNGMFEEILDDPKPPKKPKGVVLCAGKVYYEIMAEASKRGKRDFALIRIEQLYPLHEKRLTAVMKKYSAVTDWVWAQEEPRNMGAWRFIRPRLKEHLPKNGTLRYVGRERSASPAAGSLVLHQSQHKEMMDALFGSSVKKGENDDG